MHGFWGTRIASAVAVLALAACVQDPTLTGATSSAPPPAVAADQPPDLAKFAPLYAARQDGAFVVPSVPVEKVPPQLLRQEVRYDTEDAPGTIIIDPANKTLHLVTGRNKAIRYGIAVGKAGFEWSGEALITDRKEWPTWTPPKEMIERKPELAKWEKGQPGGPENPLGARALYLTTNGVDYGYRIHGTPEWNSIGRNASSGCIRMMNQDVIDLYGRVPNGVKVVVLNRDGSRPTGLRLPPPAPKKPKPVEPVAEVTPAVAPVALPPMPPRVTSPLVAGPTVPGATAPAPATPTAAPTAAPLSTEPAAAEPAPEATAPVQPLILPTPTQP